MNKFACLTAALLILLVATAPSAKAQALPQQRDMQKEAQIWKELAAVSPTSVETFKRATEAMDKGDSKEAVRLYNEVMKKAQGWDVIYRRLGLSSVEAGQTKEGLGFLRKAVDLKRSPENLISLAQGTAYPAPNVEGSRMDKEKALALAAEANAKRTDKADPSYPALLAQLALELERDQEFRAATQELVDRHPDLMISHYYSGALAYAD